MPETIIDLGRKVKAKYPGEYDDLSDDDVGRKVKAKFPGAYDDFSDVSAASASVVQSDNRTAGEVALDQAGHVLKGIPQAITGIPAALAGAAGAAYDMLTGKGTGKAQEMIKGIAQPATTTARGAAALVAPGSVEQPSRQEFEQAAEGAGANLGSLLLPEVIAKVKPSIRVLPKLETQNPVTQAAVEFGRREGIPIDAATATGNKAIAGAQQVIEHSPVGGVVSQARRFQQTRAITATGERLADEVHPSPVTPEQAGSGVQSSLSGRIAALKKFEDEAYGKFRDIANAPENAREVQVGTQSAKMKSAFDDLVGQSVDSRLHGIKEVVRGGATEMTGKLKREYINPDNPHDIGKISGRFGGGFKDMFPELKNFPESPGEMAAAIEKGGSNPLYQRLRKAMRDTVIEEEGGEIRDALRNAGLEDGVQNVREVPITKEMALPVDMRPIKSQLKPMFDQMQTWMEPAKRNASAGFQAIKSIVEGPDYMPAEVAEQGLGGLKSLAREAKSPDLRNVNAGLGANAAKQLQALIDQTVSSAGPQAIDALKAGRISHAAKMGVSEVLASIREEPVQAFNQAVWAKDAGISKLRQVAKLAPDEMPKIGRAYVDNLLEKATAEGGFDKEKGVLREWQNLGPQTKSILFRSPLLIQDLDNFFMLAKKIAERPNTSNSAVVGAMVAGLGYTWANPVSGVTMMLGSGALAEMMYSPRAVRALTNGMRVSLGNKTAAALAASQILAVAGDKAQQLPPATGQ